LLVIIAVVEFYWVFDATFGGEDPQTVQTKGRERDFNSGLLALSVQAKTSSPNSSTCIHLEYIPSHF